MKKYASWNSISFLIVSIFFVAFVVTKIIESDSRERNLYIVQYLQTHISTFEEMQLIYFRNDECKKYVYSGNWVAEPRNQDCGSSEKYLPFRDSDTDSFSATSDLLSLDKVRFSEVEIKYSPYFKLQSAEFLLSEPTSGTIGYLYDPHSLTREEGDELYHGNLKGGWYAIYYHPSPF